MNKDQINKIKLQIQSEIKETEKKIASYTELCKPIAPENSIGRVSRMDAINNKSVVEAALREAKQKIQQLKIMQAKTDEKNFGTCVKCNNTIPFMRLIIRPHSKYCVNCAE